MKSSLVQRLITAAIAIPLLVASIVLFSEQNHILFFLVIIFATISGTYEMRENVLSKKGKVGATCYLSVLLPISEYLDNLSTAVDGLMLYVLAVILGISFMIEIFKSPEEGFSPTLDKVARTTLAIIYPGLLISFVTKILFLPESTAYLVLYFALVFCTDSFAYFFGMAFGKNNKGIFKVSPNKSVAGFIGGIAVPCLIGALAPIIFKDIFLFSPIQGVLLGFATSIFSCTGDLIESTFKRAAGVKDSGVIIPGRGGMLDTLDSLIIAAPVFMMLVSLFLGV